MERMVRAVMAAALGALLVYAALTFLSAWERCSRLEERLLLLQQERESLRQENESLEEGIFQWKPETPEAGG